MFGLEFPLYFIEENDESTVVSVLLLEKDLGLPISLQVTTTDLTASKYYSMVLYDMYVIINGS